MDTQQLIALYVADVTRQLPRKMRADVGNELAALLAEEMAGKTPRETTDALRAFGRPSDVAARYHPMFAIVDPADTRAFLIAAAAGLVAVVLVAAPVIARYGRDAANILMLAWLGALVVYFGLKSWSRRRWPASGQWRPRDRDRANRLGSVALILVILLGMVCYGAPQWVFAQFTQGAKLAPWLAYSEDFRDHRLPWLLAAWAGTVLLFGVLLVEGRWRPLTRAIAGALNVAIMLILVWFRFGGPMFQTAAVDAGVKSVLALIIGCILIPTLLSLYNAPAWGGGVRGGV